MIDKPFIKIYNPTNERLRPELLLQQKVAYVPRLDSHSNQHNPAALLP